MLGADELIEKITSATDSISEAARQLAALIEQLEAELKKAEASAADAASVETAASEEKPPSLAQQAKAAQMEEKEEEEEKQPPELLAAARLSRISSLVADSDLFVVKADIAFTEKAVGVLKSIPEDERAGEKGAKALRQIVGFLDALASSYPYRAYDGMHKLIDEMVAEFAKLLEERGTALFPLPGESVEEAIERAPAAAGHVAETKVLSPKDEGTLLAVSKHGEVRDGQVTGDAVVLVAAKPPTRAEELTLAACEGVAASSAAKPTKGSALGDLKGYLGELIGASEQKRTTVLRYVVNAVNRMARSGQLKAVLEALLAELKAAGFREIPVQRGKKFDDSYSPSKYERKRIASEKPAGTIVEVIQRGFLNPDGVPVQKAIVGVSAGKR